MSLQKKDISTKKNNILFTKIKTNMPKFLLEYKNQYLSYSKTSMVKNLLYKDNFLYVSMIKKIDDNCYKHFIIRGKIKKKNLI